MPNQPFLPTPLLALILLLSLGLSACGTLRTPHSGAQTEKLKVINTARQQLGVPYQYGGSSPASGFDCSGLMHYSYRQAGLTIPRTSKEQYRQARPVSRRHLQAGDLIFFRNRYGSFVSHVGMYLGDGEFIHAPSSGKKVSIKRLDTAYWKKHFYAAGRFY